MWLIWWYRLRWQLLIQFGENWLRSRWRTPDYCRSTYNSIADNRKSFACAIQVSFVLLITWTPHPLCWPLRIICMFVHFNDNHRELFILARTYCDTSCPSTHQHAYELNPILLFSMGITTSAILSNAMIIQILHVNTLSWIA